MIASLKEKSTAMEKFFAIHSCIVRMVCFAAICQNAGVAKERTAALNQSTVRGCGQSYPHRDSHLSEG
jgi:hypothetical protein